MNRLKDFYQHKIMELRDSGIDGEIESYQQWLDRIGVTEEEDDEGIYGDENPSWIETPPESNETED